MRLQPPRLAILPMEEPARKKPDSALRKIDQPNWAAGFCTLWHRREKVIQEGGVLKIQHKVSTGEFYAPAANPDLPCYLAEVHAGRITPQQFASEFGLLGHFALVPPERRMGGDPIRWFMAHARTVYTCIQLLAEAQSGDAQHLRSILNSFPAGPYAEQGRIYQKTFIATCDWPKRPRAVAFLIVRNLINPNLEGIRFKLHEAKNRGGHIWLGFRALIEVIYWHLANLAANGRDGRSIHRCVECGQFFIAKDERQQYCPHPLAKGRSRCASRHNVRLHRKKERRGREASGCAK